MIGRTLCRHTVSVRDSRLPGQRNEKPNIVEWFPVRSSML